MIDIRHLTPPLRKKLKKPLGILFRGSLEETISILKTLVEKENDCKRKTVLLNRIEMKYERMTGKGTTRSRTCEISSTNSWVISALSNAQEELNFDKEKACKTINMAKKILRNLYIINEEGSIEIL